MIFGSLTRPPSSHYLSCGVQPVTQWLEHLVCSGSPLGSRLRYDLLESVLIGCLLLLHNCHLVLFEGLLSVHRIRAR